MKSNSPTIDLAQADAWVPTKITKELLILSFIALANFKSASILGVLVPITTIFGFSLTTNSTLLSKEILSATASINLHLKPFSSA